MPRVPTNIFDPDKQNADPVKSSPPPPSYDEPRRSARLMDAAKGRKSPTDYVVFDIDDIEADNVSPRPVKLQLHKLSKTLTTVINDCANLALRSHVVEHCDYDDAYRRTCVREVREVRKAKVRGGADYWIIFRGQTSNGVEVYEGVVFQDSLQRKVIRTRTLEPYKEQCVTKDLSSLDVPTPLHIDSSADVITKPTISDLARKRSYSLMNQARETSNQNGQAVDVKTAVLPKTASRMKWLGQRVETKLVLHELDKSHRRIIEECAALMMQDYAVQVFTKGLRFIKLVEAESSVSSAGCCYSIVFEGATDMNGVATFAGTVGNTESMRQVMRVRTLKPQLGKRYFGKLAIPLGKGLDLSQFEPSAC